MGSQPNYPLHYSIGKAQIQSDSVCWYHERKHWQRGAYSQNDKQDILLGHVGISGTQGKVFSSAKYLMTTKTLLCISPDSRIYVRRDGNIWCLGSVRLQAACDNDDHVSLGSWLSF